MSWWQRAATSGHARAQHALALAYLDRGKDAPSNNSTAVHWLEAATTQGFPRSMYTLGKMHLIGLGVSFEPDRAFDLIHRAAQAGFPPAMYNLGKLHRDGIGSAPDAVAAAQWFGKAAARGYAKAQSRYAHRLAEGDGIAKDEVDALKWAILAARQGDEPAAELRQDLEARLSMDAATEGMTSADDFRPTTAPK
jgi:hypothetical protein